MLVVSHGCGVAKGFEFLKGLNLLLRQLRLLLFELDLRKTLILTSVAGRKVLTSQMLA
jgi:hypothetical protein